MNRNKAASHSKVLDELMIVRNYAVCYSEYNLQNFSMIMNFAIIEFFLVNMGSCYKRGFDVA